MFDIGFWELVLVGVVALLVFGPERLPRVARETALWLRKARSLVAGVKAEIDQELQLQEIRQSLLEKKKSFEKQAAALGMEEPARFPQQGAKPADRRETAGEADRAGE